MKKFFYFRDVTNEDADLTSSTSVTVPVDRITGMYPNGKTTLLVLWKSLKNVDINEWASLTISEGKMKEVMAEIVSAMNSGPHNDGFVVIADNVTTTDGATSIQGNDKTVTARYLSNDITNVAITTT